TQAKILDAINLSVYQNDILGLVGETGAGKSVLIDSIGCNLTPPLWLEAEKLSIILDHQIENLLEKEEGELRKIWGKGIAFIASNARDRLNPILTIGQQFSNILQANFNLSREEAYKKAIEMFEMVQMSDPKQNFNNYPHELSGGMAQRVVISIALSMSPKLLLADEPTMGLDVTIQRQVLDLMASILRNLQSSVILATRDLGIVANYCNKVAVMCNGQLAEFTEVREFFKNAVHPYSHYLLKAAFASHKKEDLIESESAITKDEMELRRENSCRFVNRCPLAQEVCWSANPPEKLISPTHYIRCHR
ncbi:ABC transporter ATP-binding protein, partial [bacterium]|nr:ABC transporter ATP-binding protein [bacterium]